MGLAGALEPVELHDPTTMIAVSGHKGQWSAGRLLRLCVLGFRLLQDRNISIVNSM